MNKLYKIEKIVNERYAVWYMNFPKKRGNKIGVYRIIDLYSQNRETRFAFRYLPREGQTQEQSDDLIISNSIFNFYKKRTFLNNHGGNTGLIKTA